MCATKSIFLGLFRILIKVCDWCRIKDNQRENIDFYDLRIQSIIIWPCDKMNEITPNSVGKMCHVNNICGLLWIPLYFLPLKLCCVETTRLGLKMVPSYCKRKTNYIPPNHNFNAIFSHILLISVQYGQSNNNMNSSVWNILNIDLMVKKNSLCVSASLYMYCI